MALSVRDDVMTWVWTQGTPRDLPDDLLGGKAGGEQNGLGSTGRLLARGPMGKVQQGAQVQHHSGAWRLLITDSWGGEMCACSQMQVEGKQMVHVDRALAAV